MSVSGAAGRMSEVLSPWEEMSGLGVRGWGNTWPTRPLLPRYNISTGDTCIPITSFDNP